MRQHLEHKGDQGSTAAFAVVFSRKSAIVAICLSSLMFFGHFLIIPFINPFMEFNVGFTKNQIPLTYVVGGMATLFSAPLFGRLADKKGKLKSGKSKKKVKSRKQAVAIAISEARKRGYKAPKFA